jgi:signal-transduction protein with cAMP-binding, CBS, and nucleotidyltransferase domain
MLSKNVENAVILNGSKLMGLISDSQLGYRIAASKGDPTRVAISEFVAEEEAVALSPKANLHEAVWLMWLHGYRKLPVLKGGRPVGIISTSEIAEHALACNFCMEKIFRELERREKKIRTKQSDNQAENELHGRLQNREADGLYERLHNSLIEARGAIETSTILDI